MKKLDGIRATGVQDFSTTIENGDSVKFTLHYSTTTQAFKLDVEWNDFILKGFRVFSSPNILIQYQNVIPFGLAVVTEGTGDPFLINDFSTGRAVFYVLSPSEVQEVCDFYTSLRDAG